MLAELASGKTQLKIRIYKYPETSTARLLGLKSGGSGTLCNLCFRIPKNHGSLSGAGLMAPVIVIYDSDDGAKSIRNAIKNVSKVKTNRH